MKRLFTVLILTCLFSGLAFSQVSFGPKLGVNFSTYQTKVSSGDDDTYLKYKVGPSIGAMVNVKFNDFLSLQPSLIYTKKGSATDMKKTYVDDVYVSSIDGYERIKVGYIEIPINLAFGLDLGSGQIQLFVGPYIAIGINGKYKVDATFTAPDGTTDTEKFDFDIKFANKVKYDDMEDEKLYMSSLDYGLNFGLGYQFDPILINVGYSMGLANLNTEIEDSGYPHINDETVFNRVIFVNVAWLFGGK